MGEVKGQVSHSVESPSMVDPQWNIWYWGSKWNLHTVCWSAVGCEWLLMFALSLVDFLSLLLSPSTYFNIFYFCQKYHLNYTYKIFHCATCHCEGLQGIAYANILVTTQWPLKRAAHLTSLFWVCVLWLPWNLNGAICAMEWVIQFNGLSENSGQRGPYSPHKPCNYSLYIGIVIFPHIDTTRSTGHN